MKFRRTAEQPLWSRLDIAGRRRPYSYRLFRNIPAILLNLSQTNTFSK